MNKDTTIFTRPVKSWYLDWVRTKFRYTDSDGKFGLENNEYYVYFNKYTKERRILIATPTSILAMRKKTRESFDVKMKVFGIDVSETINNIEVIVAKE